MLTVGICEDDNELRAIVRAGLEREGYAVRSTTSGTEAAVAFARTPPDVLILDIGLPDADGRDVCQALRAQGVDVPVIFLTARDAVADRLSGFGAGADDYLTKPFARRNWWPGWWLSPAALLLRRVRPAQTDSQPWCSTRRPTRSAGRVVRSRSPLPSSGCWPNSLPSVTSSCAGAR